jgi:Leucine-rich repeat (LRR) protein
MYQLSGNIREKGVSSQHANDEGSNSRRRDDDHDDLQSAIEDDINFDAHALSAIGGAERGVGENSTVVGVGPSIDEENRITPLIRDEAEETQNVPPSAPAQPNPSQTTFEGVLAEDPSQIRDSMLQNAVEAKDVRVFDETGGKWKRWMPYAIGGIVLLVLVAVGVSLGVVIPRQRSAVLSTTESPSAAPSEAPSQAPTSTSFSVIAQAVESVFGTTLDDTTSPQYKAAQWMAEEDQLIVDPSNDLSRFAQRYAMVVFYYATGGDTSWIRQANFLSPTLDICSWQEENPTGNTTLGIYGIQCGNIFAIEFFRNNLTGTLPDELGALSSLNALLLNWNSLSGPVPPTIFNDNLQYLSLPFNNVTGTIPTDVGSGAMLQIWFQESSLSGTIPSELGRNTDLQALTLSYSMLTGTIPDTLLNLSEMILLDISFNKLSGVLPLSFPSRWSKMEQFTFGTNHLRGTLPDTIGNLPLRILGAGNNSLTGTIPNSLLNISNLTVLNLEANHFTGSLPFDWSRLSLLEFLSLANNKLTGSLPLSMANLTSLSVTNLANNSFSSTIPPDFGALTNIKLMLLQENSFTGTVPRTIRRWTSLNSLTLNLNNITGDMSFMCNSIDTTRPWTSSIVTLYADCLGEVVCPCCTICCAEDDTCDFQ